MTRAFTIAARIGLAAAVAGLTASLASAGRVDGTVIRFNSGNCSSIMFAGIGGGKRCKPELATVFYRSGMISFVFTAADGRLISFLGRIGKQEGGQAILRVGQISTIRQGAPRVSVMPALGSCVVTAFPAGRDRLECAAQAQGRRYYGLFKANGPPKSNVTL